MEATAFADHQDYPSMAKSWLSRTSFFFRWKYALIFLVVMGLYVILDSWKAAIIVGTLGVVAAYSTYYKKLLSTPTCIEFVTLGTIITSLAYGPFVGAAFGIIATVASELVSTAVDAMVPFYAFARGFVGFITFFLGGFNIVAVGIAMILLSNTLVHAAHWIFGDIEKVAQGIYFFATNSAANVLAFLVFGNILLAIAA